ncbi:MAG: divergent PAP2 family protein, partial [Tumebacillaceae bacterium]
HTTVVTTPLSFIGFMEGFDTPIFSLGLAFLMITVIDATGVRRAIGKHAAKLNTLQSSKVKDQKALREKQGHTWTEVFGGLVLGTLIGYTVYLNI